MTKKNPPLRDINTEILELAKQININKQINIDYDKCSKCNRPLNKQYVTYWHEDSVQKHLFCNAECSYSWWSANGLI